MQQSAVIPDLMLFLASRIQNFNLDLSSIGGTNQFVAPGIG